MHRSVTLTADPSAMVRARDAMDDLAPLVDEGMWRDLRIAVSELVANALRHGSTDGGNVELVLAVTDGVLRAEVYDDGAGFEPPEPTPGDEGGGWGLYIVDLISERWGVERAPRSCVWLEVATTPAAIDDSTALL